MQGLAEYHKSMIRYEEKLSEAPKKQELEETAAEIKGIQKQLAEANARVKALEKENESLKVDYLTATRCRDEAEILTKAADSRVTHLLGEKQELLSQIQEMAAEHEAEARRAVKSAKQEVIEAHYAILEDIKAKFEAKKVQHDAELDVQDAQSNVELLDDYFGQKITDLQAEYDNLKNKKLPKRIRKLAKKTVSDFSKSKYKLPSTSGASITPAAGAPEVPDQLNESLVGADPVEPAEVGGGVASESLGEEALAYPMDEEVVAEEDKNQE